MALRFRNLEVTPDGPLEEWGAEGIATAIDRGSPEQWGEIIAAVRAAPFGSIALVLEEALMMAESPGITALMRRALNDARATPVERTVARLRSLAGLADLTQGELAARLGTSRTRLNSYLSGAVAPSAVFVQRLEDLAMKRRNELV